MTIFPLQPTSRFAFSLVADELPDDIRAVEAQFSLCDDFLPQFALATEMGRQFSDAWFAARQVIDLGRRASKPGGGNSPGPTP